MASIISITQSGITGVDLGSTPWKLLLKETSVQENDNQTNYFFGIAFAYPPADFQLLSFSVMSLIRTQILVATEAGEVTRIADVALAGGSLDKDKDRTKEAFELFRNKPRIKGTTLESDIDSAQTILEVYWELQEWIANGMQEEKEIIEADTKLLLIPSAGFHLAQGKDTKTTSDSD